MVKQVVNKHTVRLYPNKEQEERMRKHAYACSALKRQLLLGLKAKGLSGKRFLSGYDLLKEVPKLKENPDNKWMNDINYKTLQIAAIDLSRDFNDVLRHGIKKKRKRGNLSFPVCSGDKGLFYFEDYYTVYIDGVGRVRYESDREMQTGKKHVFSDVRVSNLEENDEWTAEFGMGF